MCRLPIRVFMAVMLVGCAASRDWSPRLSGQAVVLLGEVHDNADGHRRRADALRAAVERGWRPAIAMEQFDIDRQSDIDRARAARPGDAQFLIEQSTSPTSGWDWDLYRPMVALALHADLPLIAANLPAAQTRRIVREGLPATFDPSRMKALGLDRPVAADWQAAQEKEIADGHCGALPLTLLPAMANAQFARDAVMADLLKRHADRGIVLIAGNGHVRRDLGVPRWLTADVASRSLVVGYLEDGESRSDAFDAVVMSPAATRDDPCASFRAPAG